MENKILYRSFEEYIVARLEATRSASTGALLTSNDSLRSYATKERTKLEKMCSALGVRLELFKPNSTYLMTLGCCEFFDCLLDWYESDYGSAIRNEYFSKIPKTFLIEVRGLLFDALRDAGFSNDQVVEEIRLFEDRTGCPKRIIAKPLSEPVAEAIQIYRDTIGEPDQEWDLIADYLEFYYLSEIKPTLIKALTEAIPTYIDAKKYADELTEQVLSENNAK